jgi:hypothetical protein
VSLRITIVPLTAAFLALFLGAATSTPGQLRRPAGASPSPNIYDVVIRNGRVMDPESGLDSVRNIGVSGGVIRAISAKPLRGRVVIDATGLVVAPGFIDVMWEIPPAFEPARLLDGVTTALKLWMGTDDVDGWYAGREGRALANFGVAVGHVPSRMAVMRDPGKLVPAGDALRRAATDAEIAEIRQKIALGLRRGAVAVALSRISTPAASGWEGLETFRAAGRARAVVWGTPAGINWEAEDTPRSLTELIGMAAATGAELCVVHISAYGPHTPRLLRIVEEAKAQGLKVTGEVFPYTSALSRLKLFDDSDAWRSWPDESFHDLESMETGERLTRESYARHLERDATIIVHNKRLEPILIEALVSPHTLIVSAGYLDEKGHGHPRSTGTHARVLGHHVRERGELSLMNALRKMSLMPAQLIEGRVPALRRKGRIRVGTDADIVVFDADRIIDGATFREPTRPSEGVRHVLVNGMLVVKDGALQQGVRPGKPVRAPIDAAQ